MLVQRALLIQVYKESICKEINAYSGKGSEMFHFDEYSIVQRSL